MGMETTMKKINTRSINGTRVIFGGQNQSHGLIDHCGRSTTGNGCLPTRQPGVPGNFVFAVKGVISPNSVTPKTEGYWVDKDGAIFRFTNCADGFSRVGVMPAQGDWDAGMEIACAWASLFGAEVSLGFHTAFGAWELYFQTPSN